MQSLLSVKIIKELGGVCVAVVAKYG